MEPVLRQGAIDRRKEFIEISFNGTVRRRAATVLGIVTAPSLHDDNH